MNELQIIDVEVKLYVNQRLFEKGHISEEMYTKAMLIILKEMPKSDSSPSKNNRGCKI